MQSTRVEQQFRDFLLGIAGFIFIGTIIELALIEHIGDIVQWVPFILCGLGLISLLAVWFAPGRKTLLSLRGIMSATALGSLYGLYEHFITNFEFSQEIHPAYTIMENVWVALKGASPMLAPGILFLGALLAVAATYRHPVLEE